MSHVADLTAYEMQRVRAIVRWKGEIPGGCRGRCTSFGGPLGRLGATLIPENIMRKALDSLEAKLDADRQVQEVLREAQAGSVQEMSRRSLEESRPFGETLCCPRRAAPCSWVPQRGRAVW